MRLISNLLLTAVLSASVSWSSSAKLPEDVKSYYSAYQAALEKNDFSEADSAAYDAWQAAEKSLGDHKTTGDLAMNYALMTDRMISKTAYDKKEKAFKRAIELASAYDNPEETEIQRRIEYLYFRNTVIKATRRKASNFDVSKSDFNDLLERLEEMGLEDSLYNAEIEALRVKYYFNNNKFKSAVEHAETVSTAFSNNQDTSRSSLESELNYDVGMSYFRMKDYLNAALHFQKNIENTENLVLTEKKSDNSEDLWQKAWLNLFSQGKIEEAKASGICNCMKLVDDNGRPERLIDMPGQPPAIWDLSLIHI